MGQVEFTTHKIMTVELYKNTMITACSAKGVDTQQKAWLVLEHFKEAAKDDLPVRETTPRSMKSLYQMMVQTMISCVSTDLIPAVYVFFV